MSEVRRHQRRTASGKRTTVRHHTRSGEKTLTRREAEAEEAREAWADRNAPHVSSLAPAEPEPQAQEWWAGDDEPPPGEFWDEDSDEPEHSPAFAAMLKQNPSLGDERYEKLRRLRESGYDGPIDQDGRTLEEKNGQWERTIRAYADAERRLGQPDADPEVERQVDEVMAELEARAGARRRREAEDG